MKIRIGRKNKKYGEPMISIYGIRRNQLSLLLSYAKQGMFDDMLDRKTTDASKEVTKRMLNLVNSIDVFINDPAQVGGVEMEIKG